MSELSINRNQVTSTEISTLQETQTTSVVSEVSREEVSAVAHEGETRRSQDLSAPAKKTDFKLSTENLALLTCDCSKEAISGLNEALKGSYEEQEGKLNNLYQNESFKNSDRALFDVAQVALLVTTLENKVSGNEAYQALGELNNTLKSFVDCNDLDKAQALKQNLDKLLDKINLKDDPQVQKIQDLVQGKIESLEKLNNNQRILNSADQNKILDLNLYQDKKPFAAVLEDKGLIQNFAVQNYLDERISDDKLALQTCLENDNLAPLHEHFKEKSHNFLKACNSLFEIQDLDGLIKNSKELNILKELQVSTEDALKLQESFNQAFLDKTSNLPFTSLETLYREGSEEIKTALDKLSAGRFEKATAELNNINNLNEFNEGDLINKTSLNLKPQDRVAFNEKVQQKYQDLVKNSCTGDFASLKDKVTGFDSAKKVASVMNLIKDNQELINRVKGGYENVVQDFLSLESNEDALAFANNLIKTNLDDAEQIIECLKDLNNGSFYKVAQERLLMAQCFKTVEPYFQKAGLDLKLENLNSTDLIALNNKVLEGKKEGNPQIDYGAIKKDLGFLVSSLAFHAYVSEHPEVSSIAQFCPKFFAAHGNNEAKLRSYLDSVNIENNTIINKSQFTKLKASLFLFRNNPQRAVLKRNLEQVLAQNQSEREALEVNLRYELATLINANPTNSFFKHASLEELVNLAKSNIEKSLDPKVKAKLEGIKEDLELLNVYFAYEQNRVDGQSDTALKDGLEKERVILNQAKSDFATLQVRRRKVNQGSEGETLAINLIATQDLLAKDGSDLTSEQLESFGLPRNLFKDPNLSDGQKISLLFDALENNKELKALNYEFQLLVKSYLELQTEATGENQAQVLDKLVLDLNLDKDTASTLKASIKEREERQDNDLQRTLLKLDLFTKGKSGKYHANFSEFSSNTNSTKSSDDIAKIHDLIASGKLQEAREAFHALVNGRSDSHKDGSKNLDHNLDLMSLSKAALLTKEHDNQAELSKVLDHINKKFSSDKKDEFLNKIKSNFRQGFAMYLGHDKRIDEQIQNNAKVTQKKVQDLVPNLNLSGKKNLDLLELSSAAAFNLTLISLGVNNAQELATLMARDHDSRELVQNTLVQNINSLGIDGELGTYLANQTLNKLDQITSNELKLQKVLQKTPQHLSFKEKAIYNATHMKDGLESLIANFDVKESLTINSSVGADVKFKVCTSNVKASVGVEQGQEIVISKNENGQIEVTLSSALKGKLGLDGESGPASIGAELHASGQTSATLSFSNQENVALFIAFAVTGLSDPETSQKINPQEIMAALKGEAGGEIEASVEFGANKINYSAEDTVADAGKIGFSVGAGGFGSYEVQEGSSGKTYIKSTAYELSLSAGLYLNDENQYARAFSNAVQPIEGVNKLANEGLSIELTQKVQADYKVITAAGGNPALEAQYTYTLLDLSPSKIVSAARKFNLSETQTVNLLNSFLNADPKPESLTLSGGIRFNAQDKVSVSHADKVIHLAEKNGNLNINEAQFSFKDKPHEKCFNLNLFGALKLSHENNTISEKVLTIPLNTSSQRV